jgi:hypothetical protein
LRGAKAKLGTEKREREREGRGLNEGRESEKLIREREIGLLNEEREVE